MNIGILTLSASDNCGSLLQSYALKKILEKYGKVEIINFSSEGSHLTYDIIPKKIRIKNGMKRLVKLKSLIANKQAYDGFRRYYLDMTEKEYFAKDLGEISNKYDIVIAGSDQVWNVEMADFDEAFFLGWTNSKKIAYAPSLGGRHLRLSSDFEQIKKWLKDFQSISVREEIGERCLEEVTGRKIPKVLDPTLILEEEEWKKLVGEPLIKEEYIFYYSWAYCEDATSNIVSVESTRTGLPVYVIDPRKWIERDAGKWNFVICKENGPIAFLNLMYYAKKCFVESFHGMIFAYLFKKDFWLLDTHQNIRELDSRLMELVRLLDVQERVLTEYNFPDKNLDVSFEYADNEMLEKQRAISREYLEKGIKE